MASGKFINTTHKETLTGLTNAMKDILKNPYYLFNDKKGTEVEYYNINSDKSTMDEAAKIIYSQLEDTSPVRYNIIHDFLLYGIERIQIQLEHGDYGLESGEISGEAFILPNTIQPYPGDFFTINYMDQKYLFKIIDVSSDTIEDGANIWKLNYKLDQKEDTKIKELLADSFEFNITTVGTKFKSVIRKEKYDMATLIDEVAVVLKNYYKSLYYNSHVQTFVYEYTEDNFIYDPFLIEFLIKFGLLKNSGEGYLYISHSLPVDATFSMEYRKTIFEVFEKRDPELVDHCPNATLAFYIDDMTSIFATRAENYYRVINRVYNGNKFIDELPILNTELYMKIKNHEYFSEDRSYLNILIRYLYKEEYRENEIMDLYNLSYRENEEAWTNSYFYLLPLLIFCLEAYEKQLLS